MATKPRRQVPTLAESLYAEPYDYEFHQAVRVLEHLRPKALPLGEGLAPGEEAVQIKSRITLSTPSSDIFALEPGTKDAPPIMHVNFWGIAGLQGPLPIPYTELILERIRKKDTALKEFLDLFNHRLVSLLHRVRRKYWPALNTIAPHKTAIGEGLIALLGANEQDDLPGVPLNPQSLLFYSGLLWQQPRSAPGLIVMLSHYFDAPVSILENKGRWLPIAPDQVTRIGENGQFNVLGQGAMMGTKAWSTQTGLTIRIGPLDNSHFREFLKNGSAYPTLVTLARFYLPKEFKFNINLIMKADDVCATKLNGKSELGWTSWLKEKPTPKDDSQVRLYPSSENG